MNSSSVPCDRWAVNRGVGSVAMDTISRKLSHTDRSVCQMGRMRHVIRQGNVSETTVVKVLWHTTPTMVCVQKEGDRQNPNLAKAKHEQARSITAILSNTTEYYGNIE